MVIQDPSLVELLGKDESERDRLILLGIRMLMAFDFQYYASETGVRNNNMESSRNVWRSIYTRPRLNYGIPLVWETFAARNRSSFVIWFEENVISAQ